MPRTRKIFWGLVGIAVSLAGDRAYGQAPTNSTWIGPLVGAWETAANWDPTGVPESAINNVFINDGISTVNLSTTGGATANLTLGSGNSLNLNPAATLEVSGNLVNGGQIQVGNSGYLYVYGAYMNNPSNTATINNVGQIALNSGVLYAGTNVTLNGGGTLYLNGGTISGLYSLTNVDNLIAGAGQIGGSVGGSGGALINNSNGLILANLPGQTLTLTGATTANQFGVGIINAGTLGATNGGTLQIGTVTAGVSANVMNNGGTIKADTGGMVQLVGGSTIQGGTLQIASDGSSTMETAQNAIATLNSVAISGAYTGATGSTTVIQGTINLGTSNSTGGSIQLNAGTVANTYLVVSGNATLSGGTVTLNSAIPFGGFATPPFGQTSGQAIIEATGVSTLTNAASNTIQGSGVITNGVLNGLPVSGMGSSLTLVNQGVVNANQPGGTLALSADLEIGLGVLAVTNTGTLEATNSGALAISTVVNNAGGTIIANGGSVSLLPGNNVTNTGTLEATNSGALAISTVVNNAGGTIIADGGSVNLLNGATITGGVLTCVSPCVLPSGLPNGFATPDESTVTLNAMTINGPYRNNFTSNTTMLSSTLNGTYSGDDGSTLSMSGTLNNVDINGAPGKSDLTADGLSTTLLVSGPLTLTGGGTLSLSSVDVPTGKIGQVGVSTIWGETLTNMDNTIQGSGLILPEEGSTINNLSKGTINANSMGQVLLLDGEGLSGQGGGSINNTGTLEATGGGILQIAAPVNNNGGLILANGQNSMVQVYNAITGGTLQTLNGGWLGTTDDPAFSNSATIAGAPALNSVTIAGTFTAGAPTHVSTEITIQPNSTLTVNGGAIGNGQIIVDANTTLNGGGVLVLNSPPGGNAPAQIMTTPGGFAAGVTLTNATGNTIQGSGQIGVNGLALVNQAGAVVNANVPGAPLTLSGFGQVTNSGLLEATDGATLVISSPVNNAGGNITATGLGLVQISAASVNNLVPAGSPPGNITADGGTVQLMNSSVVNGGFLITQNGGILGTAANNKASLNAVTILGTYTADSGSQTLIGGPIGIGGNGGNILMNPALANTDLTLAANASLNGGALIMTTLAGNSFVGGPGWVLTNNSTIEGSGVIGTTSAGVGGLQLVNQLTINAYGGTLLLNGGGNVTNNGLMEATNGGTLQIFNPVVNTGGNIAANGGTVQLMNGSNVTGGNVTADGDGSVVQLMSGSFVQNATLTASNGGTLGTAANNSTFLDAVTINGTYTADAGSLTIVNDTITNNGNILVNGATANADLTVFMNATLNGGGTVTLTGSAYLGGLPFGVPATTLTNVDNTIQGSGVIGTTSPALAPPGGLPGLVLINQGIVNANSPGEALDLTGGSVTNTGLLEATNGGILGIESPITNTGGNIAASGGGIVQIESAISNAGGTITANGGAVRLLDGSSVTGGILNAVLGTIVTDAGGSATLDSVIINGNYVGGPLSTTEITSSTLTGTYTGSGGSVLLIDGTFNNTGNSQLNAAGAANTFLLVNSGNLTLAGGGVLTLTAGNGGAPYIAQFVSGTTLTNVDNTIQGSGVIGQGAGAVGVNGLALVNEAAATINANVTGQTLTVGGGGTVSNQGLLEATNGGILQIANPVGNGGGNITANAGTVQLLTGSSVAGGNLNTLNGGWLGTAAGNSTTLDSVTINGAYTADSGSTTNLRNTITNTGAILINGGSGQNTVLQAANNVTLNGGGTVTLTSGGGGTAFIEQAVPGLTLTNVDNTIQGSGVIGGNGLSVVNQASGTLLANAPGQTLTINGGGNLTNNAAMQVNAGSTMAVSSALTNFSGNTLTGGTYIVNGAAGQTGTMQLASLGNSPGGEIVNNAASIVLNGPTANTLLVDAGGNSALTPLSANSTAASSFTIAGGYDFSTTGDFQNAGSVNVGAGSTLSIGPSGGSDYTQSGGSTVIAGALNATNYTQNGGDTDIITGGIISVSCSFNLLGGSVQVDGTLDPVSLLINSGDVSGTGTMEGDLSNSGILQPGDIPSPGTLSLTGDYTQTPTGTFMEDIGAGGSGQFSITGSASLGGTLDIALLYGLVPTDGEMFTILTYNNSVLPGAFSAVDLLDDPGQTVSVLYGLNGVQVEFQAPSTPDAPEPDSILLLGSGLACLIMAWLLGRARSRHGSLPMTRHR